MQTNLAGRNLIKRAEGLRLEAYLCPAGVLTIGYGHTRDVKPGMKVTEHQADVIFEVDLGQYEQAVNALVKVPLNQNQYSALVSFTFNLGVNALAKSTLLKKLNASDYAGAAEEFPKWTFAKGKKLDGLLKRRAAERALFLEAVH